MLTEKPDTRSLLTWSAPNTLMTKNNYKSKGQTINTMNVLDLAGDSSELSTFWRDVPISYTQDIIGTHILAVLLFTDSRISATSAAQIASFPTRHIGLHVCDLKQTTALKKS